MGHAVDDARKRPAVAAQARLARAEVEVVAASGVARPGRRGDRDVAHDRPCGEAARPDERAADEAAAAVGADDHRCPVGPPGGLDAHAGAVPRHVRHALLLAQLHTPVARRPGEVRVELPPADDPAEIVAGDRELAPAGEHHAGMVHPRLRHRQRHVEAFEQADGLRDHAAGARLVAGMPGLLEQHRPRRQRRRAGSETERRRRAGRAGADDDDVAAFHRRLLYRGLADPAIARPGLPRRPGVRAPGALRARSARPSRVHDRAHA